MTNVTHKGSKKNARRDKTNVPTHKPEDRVAKNHELLVNLDKKINSAKVMNGGFDALMVKIGHIEEGQNNIKETVGSIHTAIYDPDDGIFARIKNVEISKQKEVDDVEKSVLLLNEWKDRRQSDLAKEERAEEAERVQLQEHDEKIRALIETRDKSRKIITWLVVTLVTGVGGLIGKLVYDLITHAVTIN